MFWSMATISRKDRSSRMGPPASNMTINLNKVDFRSLGIVSFLEASLTVLDLNHNCILTQLPLKVKFCTILWGCCLSDEGLCCDVMWWSAKHVCKSQFLWHQKKDQILLLKYHAPFIKKQTVVMFSSVAEPKRLNFSLHWMKTVGRQSLNRSRWKWNCSRADSTSEIDTPFRKENVPILTCCRDFITWNKQASRPPAQETGSRREQLDVTS